MLCLSSWLFEGVGRQKAEELLLLPGNRVGSFLVRECTRERGESADVTELKCKKAELFHVSGTIRCLRTLSEAQDYQALSHLQTGKQLVLHLPSTRVPVLGGYDQPLLG